MLDVVCKSQLEYTFALAKVGKFDDARVVSVQLQLNEAWFEYILGHFHLVFTFRSVCSYDITFAEKSYNDPHSEKVFTCIINELTIYELGIV